MRMISMFTALCLLAATCWSADEIDPRRARLIEQAAPARPRVEPKRPRKVLIFVTPPHLMEKDPHKGYCIPFGSAAFTTLGRKTGAYEPVPSDDLAMLLPDRIKQFDAIILNNTSGPWITPTDAQSQHEQFRKLGADKGAIESRLRQTFLDYVANGGGLVVVHFALAGNRHWPEFKDLIGGTFTGHPWNEEIGVTVEESQHPLVAAFAGKDFRLADEIYEYGPPYDRGRLRVLLSLDPATTNMGVRWINRKDGDFALAWVKSHGKGRVFNTSFGHREEIYRSAQVLQFYLDAIQFAAGDLAAPTEPGGAPPKRVVPGSEPAPDLPGFVSLFNGKDLSGWTGDANIWSVQGGAITGQTTADVKVKENSFLLWKDETEDFELRLKFRLEGGNSGVYFRSTRRPPKQTGGEALVGMQADFSADGKWTGMIMEYTKRNELAFLGQKVNIDEKGQRQVVGALGDPAKMLAAIKIDQWNEYHVVARGGRIELRINGTPMCELDDKDPKRLTRGWLGLQVHQGPPMKVQFKDVYLRRF